MKVLIINGSPRKGGNTELALKEAEAILLAEGIETEWVNVGKEAVRGCMACGGCEKKGACVIDDIVNETAPKFEAADGVIVGSPVYFGSANGNLISFLDRLFYSTPFSKQMKADSSMPQAWATASAVIRLA